MGFFLRDPYPSTLLAVVIGVKQRVSERRADWKHSSFKRGGSLANVGSPAAGPNANAVRMTATFWVEKIKGTDGKIFKQLQYIQRVLLNFSGLSWPHISVATMVVRSKS